MFHYQGPLLQFLSLALDGFQHYFQHYFQPTRKQNVNRAPRVRTYMYCRHLNAHGLAVRLSPSHSFAGLLDRC
jgi:hypothetical protein